MLKLIGSRIVSLRITLTNTISGWSFVSSSFRYLQMALLQRLHLIDIEPDEFDELLLDNFVKQLHTLLIDVSPSNSFNGLQIEGIYLVKICSRMPFLKTCRLPFNYDDMKRNSTGNYSLKYEISLTNLLNFNQLRTLTIGIHTAQFLERLLLCIPLIENFSFTIRNRDNHENDNEIILPVAIDSHHLRYLSRLNMHCLDRISFYRMTALFSLVFDRLNHLSLKLDAYMSISDSLIISGDIIQQLCIDRLKSMATYRLSLLLSVENDMQDKFIFNSFLKSPFIHQEKSRVLIQEYTNHDISRSYHCFMIYTFPYNDTVIKPCVFSTNLQRFSQTTTNAMNLFPRINTLSLFGYKKMKYIRDLGNIRSSISSLVPWTLFTHIEINDSDVITHHTLRSILEMAYNVHTLDIFDDRGVFFRTILHNKDSFGRRINQQIKSLKIFDASWTLQNVQRFCRLLSNQFSSLKTFSFTIFASYLHWRWQPSHTIGGKNKSTKRIVNLIHFIIDHLQQLVWLEINFSNLDAPDTPCFPDLIRRQLHQYSLSRPCQFRCSTKEIQIWL
ncbi:unnamed protein product [Adineta ricciae]|uniref:Uncharacterized protein n=1 Tax=Adineta ricciae TaxID=249248 RepID=A0A815JW35_ADIRI|nr:unnamed protein product [Adineta ricciae]CAF1532651.1 unnamed protein product [Adineta ricciae]